MSSPGSVAGIIQSVSTGSAVTLAQAPAGAMGMTYLSMANSLGLAMENAVANQHNGQVLATAALAQVLVMIIAKGSKGASSP